MCIVKDGGEATEKMQVKARADLRLGQCMGKGSQVHCGKNKEGYLGQWGNYIITMGVSARRAEDIFRSLGFVSSVMHEMTGRIAPKSEIFFLALT